MFRRGLQRGLAAGAALGRGHFDLGLVRQRQEQTDAAIREFQLALQYDPELLQARCALGSALPDPADAEAEFRKALAVNPQLVCALDGLAQVLLNGGRYDAALDAGARPSTFNRMLRICSSLWRPQPIRLLRPGRPMGCRLSMAQEWLTRFAFSPIYSANIPTSRLRTLPRQHLCQRTALSRGRR